MVLMGLLVISFAIWGIADIFRGYGSQTLIKVGDTEITPQEYSRAQRDVLRVMSSDAGRTLSVQEAREAGLENRVLERLIGGAAVDTHAKSLNLGVSDEARVRACLPHGRHALHVAVAAELELEKFVRAGLSCRAGHGFRRIEAQREAGLKSGLGDADEIGDASPGCLRFEVP